MIVYNIPVFSGVTLTGENLQQFIENERIIGVKHTSMDLYQLNRMKQIDPELIVYNGHDEVFLAGLSMGADGAIGSTYNFMAEKFLKINVSIMPAKSGRRKKSKMKPMRLSQS